MPYRISYVNQYVVSFRVSSEISPTLRKRKEVTKFMIKVYTQNRDDVDLLVIQSKPEPSHKSKDINGKELVNDRFKKWVVMTLAEEGIISKILSTFL